MIHKVNGVVQPIEVKGTTPTDNTTHSENSFANTLKNALHAVNESQIESDMKTNMLIQGNDIDLHDVMISAQKASITLETSVQIQKKMLDAYNEVMRMQI